MFKDKKQRLSNIELLRIFAILLISFMHGIKSAYGSSFELNSVTHIVVNAIGNMGVTIFILISGYFSINSKPSKLFRLWCVILFYSLLIFAYNSYITYNIISHEFSSKGFIKELYTALTPITSCTWWFFTSYTILFWLAPLFNKAVDYMSKQQFLYLLAVLLFFYSISPTFLMHSVSNTPNGKCTENMILAYFIGRYFSKYGIPQMLQRHYFHLFAVCFLTIFCVNYFVFDPLFMSKDHNLFIILGAICIFIYFKNITINHLKISNSICYLASFVFPIYLLNWSLIGVLEPLYCNNSDNISYLPRFLLTQLCIIVLSIIIETIRRLLFDRLIKRLETCINNKTEHIFNFIY